MRSIHSPMLDIQGNLTGYLRLICNPSSASSPAPLLPISNRFSPFSTIEAEEMTWVLATTPAVDRVRRNDAPYACPASRQSLIFPNELDLLEYLLDVGAPLMVGDFVVYFLLNARVFLVHVRHSRLLGLRKQGNTPVGKRSATVGL